jgi:hypothetical protein
VQAGDEERITTWERGWPSYSCRSSKQVLFSIAGFTTTVPKLLALQPLVSALATAGIVTHHVPLLDGPTAHRLVESQGDGGGAGVAILCTHTRVKVVSGDSTMRVPASKHFICRNPLMLSICISPLTFKV